MSADPDRRSWPRWPAGLSRRGLSRRGLLRASLLAAAAPAALSWDATHGSAASAAPGRGLGVGDDGDDGGAAYRRAFLAALADDKNVRGYFAPGREFLYRPGQLLLAPDDRKRVQARLRELGVPARVGEGFAGVDRLLVDPDVDIAKLVDQLRDPKQWPGQRPPQVQPHHVLVGNDVIMGNPRVPPVAAAPLDSPPEGRGDDGAGVLVGVCDTGIWRDAAAFHPKWLDGCYVPQPDDEDPLYAYADVLGLQGGHGTFVAGVLRQAAPGVRFDPEPALADSGLGDEEMLVRALDQLDPAVSIVNLSLGCFTQDDLPPLTMVNRLGRLGRKVVLVASAGNSGTDRPTWPAALPYVLAVAAVTGDPQQDEVRPASYSNYGSWVDACAAGERTSTYVIGRLELPGEAPAVFRGFARWQGTSFAAPHVAGRLAGLMSATGCTAGQARDRMLAEPRWHPDFGVLVS